MWKNTSCFKYNLNVPSDHPMFFVHFLIVANYTERLLLSFDVQCTMCGQKILNFIKNKIVKCDLGKLNNKKLTNCKMSISQNLLLACNVQHFANVSFVEEISIFSLSTICSVEMVVKFLRFFIYVAKRWRAFVLQQFILYYLSTY